MKTQSVDTDPEIEARLVLAYRGMTPSQKLASVRAGNQAVQKLQMSDIRRQHPLASEREVRLRLGTRWLGAEMMRTVFGWDADQEGY